MVAYGVVTPKRLSDGRVSRRIAQLNIGAYIFIYTSWLAIDQYAMVIRGEYWLRELLRQYGGTNDPDANVVDRWGQFEGPGGKRVVI